MNIPKWLKKDKVYEVTLNKNKGFEPYFVTHRNAILYDEIFNGCGFDKVSQVHDMRAMGYKLKMLPDSFIVHLNHNDLNVSSSWCRNFARSIRYQMKTADSMQRHYKFPGLFANSYDVSWVGNGRCRGIQCNRLAASLKKSRGTVLALKFCFFTVLSVLIALVWTALKKKVVINNEN